jgi:outer membrane protein OmpA-like peptidoglycan-associated protein
VKAYLVSKGVNESQITATGYGEEQPIADNNTAAGRAKNNRIEIKLSY